jgi:S1-C subfamily serine protease
MRRRFASVSTQAFRLIAILGVWFSSSARAQSPDSRVLTAEAQRVAVVEKVKPTVVAIFARGGAGGGSGVLISKDGFALTNFHVVEGSGGVMNCGLPDGVLYEAVLVGLDKVGDVALIKLLPRKEGQEFPTAVLGDSDTVKAGDWSLAMGNPFLLATDFTPTVTFGLVSGVHRYQYPAGTLLEYTDCIQVDTSINPGNSGGPLFNLQGELIGINGRGSFEKRGRVNSGVGYAISINQIKNFLGHLKAGLDTDHATLGAVVESDMEDSVGQRLIVRSVLPDADAYRRGLDVDDELVAFAGRPMASVNQYKNVLGLFPKGWRVPLTYRHDNDKREVLVRLMGVQRQEADDHKPKVRGPTKPAAPLPPSAASKLYEAKPGFANYHFNKLERDRLLAALVKHGNFTSLTGPWKLDAELATVPKQPAVAALVAILDEKDADGTSEHTLVRLTAGNAKYELSPLKLDDDIEKLKAPTGSGGFLASMYLYRRLLTLGAKGFEGTCSHGGHEPFYPRPADDRQVPHMRDLRVDTEVLVTEHAAYTAKWFFSLKDQSLLGFEVSLRRAEDPCEVYLSDYRLVDGRQLPHRIEVRHGDRRFGVLNVRKYELGAASK